MPYTEKQRKMFNARKKSDPKMARMADEANAMKKAGEEKPPVKKAAAKKTAMKKAAAKKKGK